MHVALLQLMLTIRWCLLASNRNNLAMLRLQLRIRRKLRLIDVLLLLLISMQMVLSHRGKELRMLVFLLLVQLLLLLVVVVVVVLLLVLLHKRGTANHSYGRRQERVGAIAIAKLAERSH